MRSYLIIIVLIYVSYTCWGSRLYPIQHPDNDSLRKKVKYINKSHLVKMIDSLLEFESFDEAVIEKVKYYTHLLKNKTEVVYETDIEDLTDIHFYSEKEEKMLFPPFPLDSLPKNFNLKLENPKASNYTNPFNGVITSYYGWREKRMHKGIDIDLNKGEPVVAAFDGKVRVACKNNGGFGNLVIIMHANGLETVYAHLSKIKVKAGQIVLSGQTIGLGGNTGRSRGAHLHFETRYKGHALNPLQFINYNDNKLYSFEVTMKVNRNGIHVIPFQSELHTVQKGESWNKIAQSYNTTVAQLLKLNGAGKKYYLKPGQQIRVN